MKVYSAGLNSRLTGWWVPVTRIVMAALSPAAKPNHSDDEIRPARGEEKRPINGKGEKNNSKVRMQEVLHM
jgi:hypothetical protein